MGKSQDRERSRRTRVKVLLVDDHKMFRQGLAGMLSSSAGEEVQLVGKTPLGEEAVEVATEKNPDVLIMQVDRTLKKAKNILERIRRGSSSSPPPRVVILTMFEDERILRDLLELGVEAYLHKSASVEELLEVLRTATTTTLNGQREPLIVSLPQGKLELSDGYERGGSERIPSKRELEILLLAARGLSNHQIASNLHISESTVKRHLANLYPKMGVSSRGEAMRVALGNEWFTIGEIEAAIVEEGE
jgi:DNA-binding NarL/FixJ family response regulator